MLPDHVREEDLDSAAFRCCGDEDLFPFRCPTCGRVMVFCYECDTLYRDLFRTAVLDHDVNHGDPSKPIFACGQCGFAFEYEFMRNPRYLVPRTDWIAAGLGGLLRNAG